jgi:hypothetical protein
MDTYWIVLLVILAFVLVWARYLRITKSEEVETYYQDVMKNMNVRNKLYILSDTNSERFAKLTLMSKVKLMVGWYPRPDEL